MTIVKEQEHFEKEGRLTPGFRRGPGGVGCPVRPCPRNLLRGSGVVRPALSCSAQG